MLLWPGFRLSRAVGFSIEDAGNYSEAGIAFAWVLWTAIVAAVVTVIEKTIWPRRKLFVVCVVAAFAILFFEARGTHNKEYDGTWEFGFERSAFYQGGGCWRTPYWLDPTSELSGPSGKLEALGNPSAVRIKFIGDTSWVGSYGHLGGYIREIRVVRVIDVQAAQPCRP